MNRIIIELTFLKKYFIVHLFNLKRSSIQDVLFDFERELSYIYFWKQTMNEIKISSILERPITQQHWAQLQQIIKILKEFITQRAKNREYLQAQRGKEKVIECEDQIKKRNRSEINDRERQAIDELSRSHAEQNARLEKEWEIKKKKVEREYHDLIEKKLQRYEIEKEKYMQQIEIALPLNNSPDKELYNLRHQEEKAAEIGDFVEAQRIKMEIMKKEMELEKKFSKLREANIKTMMSDLEARQNNDLLALEARRDEKIQEIERQKGKRVKELGDKHEREIKELVWIYNEEKKKVK